MQPADTVAFKKTNTRVRAPQRARAGAAKQSFPGSGRRVERQFSSGRPRAARTDGRTDRRTVGRSPRRPPALPPGSARAPALARGWGWGPPRRPRDPAQPPRPPPGAPHRRSVPRYIALRTRCPRWLVLLRPMAPARARFENGAERDGRGPQGGSAAVAPVTDRSGPQWRRARRPPGDGGFRPSVPGNVTAGRCRGYGAPWRGARTSAVPEDLANWPLAVTIS